MGDEAVSGVCCGGEEGAGQLWSHPEILWSSAGGPGKVCWLSLAHSELQECRPSALLRDFLSQGTASHAVPQFP